MSEAPSFWDLDVPWVRLARPFKSEFQRAATLFGCFLKRKYAEFWFQSQGSPSSSVRLSLAVFVMSEAITLAVGYGFILYSKLSFGFLMWNFVKSTVFYLPLVLAPIYLALRFIAKIRSFYALLNVTMISGVAGYVLFTTVVLLGIILSPPLSGDLAAIRDGKGTATAFYKVICRPVNAKAAVLANSVERDKLVSLEVIARKVRAVADTNHMTKQAVQAALLSELSHAKQRLTPAQRYKLFELSLDGQIAESNMDETLQYTEDNWKMFRPAAFSVGVGILGTLITGLYSLWFFVRSAILNNPNGTSRIIFSALLGFVVSASVGYEYVQIAEDFVVTNGTFLDQEVQELRRVARSAELLCGPINSHGLW